MKRLMIMMVASLFVLGTIWAQEQRTYKEKAPYKSWVRLAPRFTDDFFYTEEAARIAENVLFYQQKTGGWPKNIYLPAELTEEEREAALKVINNVNESTIDNAATTTEMNYLMRMYNATKDERYFKAVLAGFDYLFEAQYDNGGWPQFYPRPTGYYIAITYNDDAMIHVMEVLRSVFEKESPYTNMPEEYVAKARAAFDKGIDCILKTQVRQNGKLTAWCAQHDHKTLLPTKARAYELPSLSGQESDNIVLLLMSLPNPSPEVKESIEAAVAWFEESKIEGLKREFFRHEDGKRDYRMVPGDGPALWARFYELGTNRPFFCDRDGKPVYSLDEIGYERRNGYSWYNDHGNKVLREYQKWKKRVGGN